MLNLTCAAPRSPQAAPKPQESPGRAAPRAAATQAQPLTGGGSHRPLLPGPRSAAPTSRSTRCSASHAPSQLPGASAANGCEVCVEGFARGGADACGDGTLIARGLRVLSRAQGLCEEAREVCIEALVALLQPPDPFEEPETQVRNPSSSPGATSS